MYMLYIRKQYFSSLSCCLFNPSSFLFFPHMLVVQLLCSCSCWHLSSFFLFFTRQCAFWRAFLQKQQKRCFCRCCCCLAMYTVHCKTYVRIHTRTYNIYIYIYIYI